MRKVTVMSVVLLLAVTATVLIFPFTSFACSPQPPAARENLVLGVYTGWFWRLYISMDKLDMVLAPSKKGCSHLLSSAARGRIACLDKLIDEIEKYWGRTLWDWNPQDAPSSWCNYYISVVNAFQIPNFNNQLSLWPNSQTIQQATMILICFSKKIIN